MTQNKFTVKIQVDAEGCLDIRNASMYSKVGPMQLRQYIRKGTLPGVKRTALDNPAGRIKHWVRLDDLDIFMSAREARRISRGISTRVNGQVCYKAQRIKSVIAMVRARADAPLDPMRTRITTGLLNDLLAEVMTAYAEKVIREES